MRRLEQIEGLRAYLALWVLVSHSLGFASVEVHTWPFAIIRRPDLAVEGFIILSGFVVFMLLDTKREPWLPFIVRRFFRLWPLFAVLTVVSILLAPLTMPPRATDTQTDLTHVWGHLLVKAPMLHGLAPESVLPRAQNAFLPPAWSISLEWQFYILAPLIYAVLRRPLGPLIVGLSVFLMVLFRPTINEFGNHAFLPLHAEFFYIGALMYFAWKRWPQIGKISAPLRLILGNRYTLFLGKISYSIYLSHWPVLTVLAWALAPLGLEGPWLAAALLPLTILATIILSDWLYRNIEAPAIQFAASRGKPSDPKKRVRIGLNV